jgi:4-diphosphocytidyl-2-C-methyl-D-erythritol kinase
MAFCFQNALSWSRPRSLRCQDPGRAPWTPRREDVVAYALRRRRSAYLEDCSEHRSVSSEKSVQAHPEAGGHHREAFNGPVWSGEPHPATNLADFDVVLYSPSKINVFLRVIRRRPDGFHELATVMQAISLVDRIGFQELPAGASADVLECNNAKVPLDKTNLIIRALDTFRTHSGSRKHYRVHLDKQIPTEAGLGGGSGNAATALFAANRLCGEPASNADLIRWASEIGSDTAFFFSSGSAFCTGRGEQLHPIRPLAPTTVYIVKPRGVGLSTASVYRALSLHQLNREDHLDPHVLCEQMERIGPLCAPLVNDLEGPAFALMPPLRHLKTFLESFGFQRVLMSGSGTSFFALGCPDSVHSESFRNLVSNMGLQHAGPLQHLFPEGVDVFKCGFIHRDAEHFWYMENPASTKDDSRFTGQPPPSPPHTASRPDWLGDSPST